MEGFRHYKPSHIGSQVVKTHLKLHKLKKKTCFWTSICYIFYYVILFSDNGITGKKPYGYLCLTSETLGQPAKCPVQMKGGFSRL